MLSIGFREPSSILPGHVTYVTQLGAEKGMRPIYTVTPDLQYMTLDLKEIQTRIKTGFFNDLFLMISSDDKTNRTAYEIAQRQQEKLQVLGPVIERFYNEGGSPAIKRVFKIMERRQLLPPIPQSLQGIPIEIEYISMLALEQRAAATTGMERLQAMAGSLASVDPGVLDLIDNDQYMRTYNDLLSNPHKIMRSKEQVEQLRAVKAKQMAQASAMQQAKETVPIAADAAKTLSETPLGAGQNALAAMLGTSSGGVAAGA